MSETEVALRIAVAALVGLAVGLEREWSGHATGPSARFAGIRTFLLLGTIGGLVGWLSELTAPVAVALLLLAGSLIVAAYLVAARRTPVDVDGTTEVAAILVLATGIVAGRGSFRLASGIAALMVLALREKTAIRRFVSKIDAIEMRAALQFAVLALVVYPLLPEGPYGPFDAIRPRMIWTVVLLFSALNFAGYLARQILGEDRGYLVTGALGGLVSSTAVTLSFSRLSRRLPEHSASLAGGVVAACTVLVPRVLVISAILTPSFLPLVATALVPMFVVGLVVTITARVRGGESTGVPTPPTANPLDLLNAIKMAVAFQLVLIGIELARSWFGPSGLVGAAVLAGLTDVDALTMSMARAAQLPDRVAVAALGLVAGVLANTALKTALAVTLGEPEFRRQVVPRMVALLVAGSVGAFLVTR